MEKTISTVRQLNRSHVVLDFKLWEGEEGIMCGFGTIILVVLNKHLSKQGTIFEVTF